MTTLPLPSRIRNGGTWIDQYVSWAMKRSPLTPCHFHEGIAYSLAACAIAGRVYVQTAQEKVHPNLYTLIVGKTSVFAKTIAMNLAIDLAEKSGISDRIINSVFTPESVVNELGGVKPSNWAELPKSIQDHWRASQKWGARRMFVIDEAGRFFNSLERDYNATLADLWMSLYDCKKTLERTSIKHGYIVIEDPIPSCLFATTPGSIRRSLRNPDMWTQGFWTRWNFHVGDEYTPFAKSCYADPPLPLVQALRCIGELKAITGSYQATVEAQVMDEYEKMLEENRKLIFGNDDEYMESFMARLHTKRLKASLILAVLETCGVKTRVTMKHWTATKNYTERMKVDVKKLSEIVRTTEKGTRQDKIISVLASQNGRATGRELQQLLHIHADELNDAIYPLVRVGIVEREDSRGKRVIFTLAKEGVAK